jgi:hypothetical protein
MRYALLASVIVGGFLLMPAQALAQQKKVCPEDATLASRTIWPAGAISTGQ